MQQLLNLVREHASPHLWRVHIHRSIFHGSSYQDKSELFYELLKLIKDKPLIDLNISCIEDLNTYMEQIGLEKFCEPLEFNKTVRAKARIAKVTELMHVHNSLKSKESGSKEKTFADIPVHHFREVIKYWESSH